MLKESTTYLSPKIEELLGYTVAEVLGKTPFDLMPPDEAGRVSQVLQPLLDNGQPIFCLENINMHKDGHLVVLETSGVPILDATGKVVGYRGIDRDVTERKGAEKAIRKAQEKYRNIFENCMEGIFQTTLDGRIINANPSAARILGYDSPEEMIRSITDIGSQVYADPKDRGRIIGMLKKNGVIENYEIKFRKKDGSTIWGLFNLRLVRDDEENIFFIEGTSQDITDRKITEENLRLHDEIIKHMAEGVCLVRTDEGVIAYANPRFEQMFGYDPGELVGKDIRILNDPNAGNPDDTAHDIMTHLSNTGFWNGDIQNMRKDGTTLWCYASISTFDHPVYGKVWVGAHGDITDRRKMEAAFTESEGRFYRLAENARDIIYRMSLPDGRYEYVSPACIDISGFTPEEYYNGTFTIQKIIHPDFEKYLEQQWEDLMEGKVPPFYEFKIIHRNGLEKWLHQRNVPIYDETGSLIALEGIATDITDFKKAEEELKKHRDRLEKLVKERTAELERKSATVEELNVALKVLLHQVQEEKDNLEQRLIGNIKRLVLPYLEWIRKSQLDDRQRTYLSVMETNLNEIMSPFLHAVQHLNLTPREAQVANLIKDGKTTKEIAEIMGVATNAIDSYRNSIRTKLGLNKKKVNLQSYLQSIS